MRELGDEGADFFDVVGGGDREEVWIGEVTIVVRVFFSAHFLGFAEFFIPAPSGLDESLAVVESLALAGNLVVDGATDGGGRVHVLELNFGSEFILFIFAYGDVHITAHLSFVHVGVGNATGDEDLLEGLEIGEGFFGGLNIWLGDDLHEGSAGAIEVDESGIGEVGRFGDVFLKVDAVEFDSFPGVLDAFLGIFWVVVVVKGDAAAEAEGEVHLGDLVVLRHVRVEVVLPIPDNDGRVGTAEEHAGEDGAFDGEFV